MVDEESLCRYATSLEPLNCYSPLIPRCIQNCKEFIAQLSHIFITVWKPSFDLPFGPFYLFKGTQARLPCKPIAEPYPTFRWFKDGVPIGNGQNDSYTLDADGSLLINDVKDGNSGRYTCMAENYLGTANATANAIVLGKREFATSNYNIDIQLTLNGEN